MTVVSDTSMAMGRGVAVADGRAWKRFYGGAWRGGDDWTVWLAATRIGLGARGSSDSSTTPTDEMVSMFMTVFDAKCDDRLGADRALERSFEAMNRRDRPGAPPPRSAALGFRLRTLRRLFVFLEVGGLIG